MQPDKRLFIPRDLRYDRNDYWIRMLSANEAVIGLTAYGQDATGDILYLELPPAGSLVRRGESSGSIESGKWVGGLLPPVTGVVLEANGAVEADPARVNRDPYGTGWLIKVRLTEPAELEELMEPGAYRQLIEDQIRRQQEEEAAL